MSRYSQTKFREYDYLDEMEKNKQTEIESSWEKPAPRYTEKYIPEDEAKQNIKSKTITNELIQAVIDGDLIEIENIFNHYHRLMDLFIMDRFGNPLLHIACIYGHLHVVKYFSKFKNFNDVAIFAATKNETTPLYLACYAGHLDIVKFLLDNEFILIESGIKGNVRQMTPLHIACSEGKLDIIKYMLGFRFIKEGSITKIDENGRTPFYLACLGGHVDIVKFLLTDRDILEKTSTKPDKYGITPLYIACIQNQPEIVEYLMSFEYILKKSLYMDIGNGYSLSTLLNKTHGGNIGQEVYYVIRRQLRMNALSKEEEDIIRENLE